MGGECGFDKGRGQGAGFSLAPLQPEGLVGSVFIFAY